MSKELESNWRNAFDFVQKFYFEVSYLIKELEGLLAREPERFLICRPSGYGVTTYKSTGLEASNVECWIPLTLTVLFVPEDFTKMMSGVTVTPYSPKLRVLLLHIDAWDIKLEEPRIRAGYLTDIVCKRKEGTKLEGMLSLFSNYPDDVFAKVPEIMYEDSWYKFQGRVLTVPLFSINSAQDAQDKIVDPVLELYRK